MSPALRLDHTPPGLLVGGDAGAQTSTETRLVHTELSPVFCRTRFISVPSDAFLSTDEIDAYLASGEWEGKAGGYAIQGIAEGLIRRIQGSHSGVVGLPLYETRTLLKSAGFDLA